MALFAVLFASCEEYYKPELEVVPGMLVVESHITNDPKQNFVRLSMTQDFYSTVQEEIIIGAKVDLIELGGQIMSGLENRAGYFTFPSTPVQGRQYKIQITYQNDIFVSELVVMPPIPAIDSLYTIHKIKKSFRTNSSGIPELFETPVREICIDAPITSQLGYYRFNTRAILQWIYSPAPSIGPPPPPWYGWLSVYDRGLFNLAGPKVYSQSNKVRQHPVVSLDYNGKFYLDSSAQSPSGWILIIDEYGITKASYDFHEKLNQQFSAEGSLFEPVLTQIYGNIKCTTSPEKIVLGFFDLNSYRQYRYYLSLGTGPDNQVIQRRLNSYPEIPDRGYQIGTRPSFWETNY